eukprot:XP_001698074.1 predicted protein [Chlamydomonas reinhardtii]
MSLRHYSITAADTSAVPGALSNSAQQQGCGVANSPHVIDNAVGASVPDADLGDAVCIVHQANRSGSPGEVVLGAKVDKLSADVGAVKAKLDQLSVMMVGIKAGQNNVVHRNMNGNSRMAEHNLQPLKAEEGEHVGEYPTQPDLFPATLGALFSLNNPQLDKLEEFYNCEFKGTSIAAWQSAFTAFIGALSARP